MKRVLLIAGLAWLASPFLGGARTIEAFDTGWLFLKTDATNAEQLQFDDSNWRKLNLPHDWSIEGPFNETNKTGGAGAFAPSGVGWYRKHFSLPANFNKQRVSVEFDGVMQNSDVWINGFHLGHRPYGYVSFDYELTGHLNFGGDNILAVRADNSQEPASRWYSGAGIYRHVRLITTDPVHFTQHGIFITTPKISATEATVHFQVTVTNESDSQQFVIVAAAINGMFRDTPLATLASGQSVEIAFDMKAPHPELWNLEHPKLYSATIQLLGSERTLDEESVSFGIRDAHFEANTGFWLNGKNFKIKGVCLHVDGSAFGTAVPSSVWEQRLSALKSLGVNAIRTAHNPPAPEFLDLCDRIGLLVMDEFFDCWTVGKNPYDYHLYFNDWSKQDERDTILRDRNHPSIILYSVGNEIHDTPKAELAKGILKGLVEVAHETDSTRPVTQALFRPNASHDYEDGLADMLDVVGQNYRENEILAAHEQKPSRKIIGTENHHDRAAWLALRDNAPYAGQFLWTGVDYLGESRRWPVVAAGSGLLDRTGAPKPMGFERQSWWSDTPMVYIARRISPNGALPTDPGYEPAQQDVLRRPQVLFHDWTSRRTEPHEENVEIYSNCKEVELFLNGNSLGKKLLNADASPRNWRVPYAPGKLKVIGRDEKGKVAATDELQTAAAPAKIVLSAASAHISDEWDSVCKVTASITDEKGTVIPSANQLISFRVIGPGQIAAVDSADNSSHESFQASERRAYEGECTTYVRAADRSGRIEVIAETPGLKSGRVFIKISK